MLVAKTVTAAVLSLLSASVFANSNAIIARTNATSTSIRCSIEGTTVITNAAQATALASACPSFTGTVSIQAHGDISLNGMETIDGALIATAVPNISSISSNSINNISGPLYLADLPRLENFNFTQLTSLGSLGLANLSSSLKNMSFMHTLQAVMAIDIQQTGLTSLEGFDLEQVGAVSIEHNPNMTSVDLHMANVTLLSIGNNSVESTVILPNLQWVNSLSLANCLKVSMPCLVRVDHALELVNNTFTDFSDAPLIHTIGEELWIHGNHNLTNFTMPKLQGVGGHVIVSDNPRLNMLNQLSALQTVGDYISVDGSFERIAFPALTRVDGSFTINSTEPLDCSIFDSYYKNGVITGSYECVSTNSSASDYVGPTNRDAQHTVKSHDFMSTGAKAGLGIVITLAIIGVASIAAMFVMRSVKRKKCQQQKFDGGDGEDDGNEKHDFFAEMPTDTAIYELHDDKQISELGRSASTRITGTEQRHELDGRSTPLELATSLTIQTQFSFELEGDSVQLHKVER